MVSLDRAGSGDSEDDAGRLSDLLVSGEMDPSSTATQAEDARWVERAMDDLSDQMRDVVHLVYFQGLKYREAADALSIPVGTVKSRLHAAIHKLNETWRQTHIGQQ